MYIETSPRFETRPIPPYREIVVGLQLCIPMQWGVTRIHKTNKTSASRKSTGSQNADVYGIQPRESGLSLDMPAVHGLYICKHYTCPCSLYACSPPVVDAYQRMRGGGGGEGYR
jgi:hypothetical protein